MLKNSFKSKIFVGKLFKEICLQEYDIYEFIISFLGSDIKLSIELDLLDLNQDNLDKYTSYLINKYNLNRVDNNYDEIILQWIGETIQSWYTDICMTGEDLQKIIDKDKIKYMYDNFYLLSSQPGDYIYGYIFDMTNEEMKRLYNSIDNLEKKVIYRNSMIDTNTLKDKIYNLLDSDMRSISMETDFKKLISKYRRNGLKINKRNRDLLKHVFNEIYTTDVKKSKSMIRPIMENTCINVRSTNEVIKKEFDINDFFTLEELDIKVDNKINKHIVVASTKNYVEDTKEHKKVILGE